jgi:hypothetical protein
VKKPEGFSSSRSDDQSDWKNFECTQMDRSHFPWHCNLLRFWEAELRGGGGAGGAGKGGTPPSTNFSLCGLSKFLRCGTGGSAKYFRRGGTRSRSEGPTGTGAGGRGHAGISAEREGDGIPLVHTEGCGAGLLGFLPDRVNRVCSYSLQDNQVH